MSFSVQTRRLRVADAHALTVPEPYRPEIWFFEPSDAAVVLGSAQSIASLDLEEVTRRGLGVVRRRSGGGAVVVEPGALTWFDLVLPATDPRFEHDVDRSALWLGRVMAEALRSLGVDADDPVSTGVRGRWASQVCFAGLSAGEVMVAGRKAVGISQRRTRHGARYQVMVPHRFDGAAQSGLFALDPAARADLAAHLEANVCAVEVTTGRLAEALVGALTSS